MYHTRKQRRVNIDMTSFYCFPFMCQTEHRFYYITAYVCYQCSYGLWADGDYRECIENPDALGFSHHLHCNRTSYCVLQEQYDISKFTNVKLSYVMEKAMSGAIRNHSGYCYGACAAMHWSYAKENLTRVVI